MRPMAQVMMVMSLDKCIGCHTCSVTCKQTWTNRPGTEYVWFNNVETKPGVGYPKRYEDQNDWNGGWTLDRKGRLRLKGGGRLKKLLTIFYNPDLPTIDDYYDPWTYNYSTLIDAPVSKDGPVARPRSQLTGKDTKLTWGSNWDDALAGSTATAAGDPDLAGLGEQVKFAYEETFMFYLPRICEHCLNPSCVASCPSGAMYKREEDGIVLVDQDTCRGWRFCVSGCPYKKVYFNHKTGKAEKCTLCYPRIEAGQPTICSETCVGRIRYLGLVLYDADAVLAAAATPDPKDLLAAQRACFLDPDDPDVQNAARAAGIAEDWIDAARRSPTWALINRYQIALPLHPEYRTMPMVWYIPPLSPVADVVGAAGYDPDLPDSVFATIDALRVPVDYLANLFTAGDATAIRDVLRRLGALRSYMRTKELFGQPDNTLAASVGMTNTDLDDMYRLLAIGKYEDRYVIPLAHAENAGRLAAQHAASLDGCSLDGPDGPGMGGDGPPAAAVDQFHLLRRKPVPVPVADPITKSRRRGRVNLLEWDGRTVTPDLFPRSDP